MSNSFSTPWTVAHQIPLSIEFCRQKYWIWLPFPFSRGSSWPRDWTYVSCIGRQIFFYLWGIREEAPYGFSSLIFILQRNYFFSFHFKQEKTGSEFTSIRSLVSIRSSDSNSVCSESGDRCAKYPPPKTHVNWKTHTHTHTHTHTN